MDNKKLIDQVRQPSNRLRNMMHLRCNPEEVDIVVFPEEWMESNSSKAKQVRGVHLPSKSKAVTAIYHAIEDGTRADHIHSTAKENIFVICGSLTINTPTECRRLERGQSFTVESNVAHGMQYDAGTLWLVTWLMD